MKLDRQTIEAALAAMNTRLEAAGVIGEICIFGGSAMVLAFDARQATRDVDAVFRPPELFRHAAVEVADELNLPENWLNDGVKGFVSSVQDYVPDDMPQFSHLRVIRPSAAYLLAMKCMAARVAGYDTRGDIEDVRFLVRHLGLRTAEQVLEIVGRYYPPERIAVKTQYFIEEVVQELPKT
jgi:hypothetical protein